MDPIDRLMRGIGKFQTQIFPRYRTLFQQLAQGQTPTTLFITCADSRIDPALITQVEPGELFVLRNPGNMVPPQGTDPSAEAAGIEYALVALKVRDIVICGHSHCGAIKGLLAPDSLQPLPRMAHWLAHAQGNPNWLKGKHELRDEQARLEHAIKQNVLVQLAQVQTLPLVEDRLAQRKLRLHGWVYMIETGEVLAYEPGAHEFLPLGMSDQDVRAQDNVLAAAKQ